MNLVLRSIVVYTRTIHNARSACDVDLDVYKCALMFSDASGMPGWHRHT